MTDIRYWLWLQKCIGYNRDFKDIIANFDTIENLYNSDENTLRLSGLFSSKYRKTSSIIDNMKKYKLSDFDKVVELCNKNHIAILTPDNDQYPREFLQIEKSPTAIYARGDVSCLNEGLKIAMIGTRNPTEYGTKCAHSIADGLAKEGITLVSGGALGLDSMAHKCAIENSSKTILVMGCGHGAPYLPENAELRKEVSKNGVLLTEYPPNTNAHYSLFPIRNRLISAISKCLVVVEAGKVSGTLNTSKHAAEQGKDIFVLPGDINSPNYIGSNNLLLNGANPVFCAQDILKYYNYEFKYKKENASLDDEIFAGIDVEDDTVPKKAVKKTKSTKTKVDEQIDEEETEQEQEKTIKEINLENFSENARIVCNVILDGVCQLDEITRNSSLPISKVLMALTELELNDIILSLGANKYVIA